MTRDKNIEWIRRRIFIPVNNFTGLQAFLRTGSTAAADATSGALLEDANASEVAGARLMGSAIDTTYQAVLLATLAEATVTALDEISTFEVAAMRMATADDSVSDLRPVPYDVDPKFPMGFRVAWLSGSDDAADTITWAILAKFFAENATLTAPAGALDTAIAQDTATGTANQLQWTARGVKNADFLTRAQVEAGAFMGINVAMTQFAAGLTQEKFLVGYEYDYVPLQTRGVGRESDANLTATGAT